MGRRKVEVGVGAGRGDPTAGRALEHARLQQERLVHLLDRLRLLRHRHRERVQADRLAAERVAQRGEDGAVDLVEAELVDLEQLQRDTREISVVTAPSARTSA